MSTLLGGIDLALLNKVTYDTYNLSDNVDSFTVDYWFPYASDCPKALVNFTYNLTTLGTPTYSFALTGGSIAHMYFYDFYNRIHSTITQLSLGNVLSEQTFAIEIWNAFLIDSILTDVLTTNLDGINLDLPITLPQTFTPLQSISGTISVSSTGIATIDGSFDLIFSTQVLSIDVSGQRVVLWPFAPQTNILESRKWLTDVIPSKAGEQRLSLREIPRLLLGYTYKFREQKEYSLATSLAKTIAHIAAATPLWTDIVKVNNLVIGQTVINVNTSYMELYPDSLIVIWENYYTYEIKEILSMTASSITLKVALGSNHANAVLMPVRIGYLGKGIDLVRGTSHKIESGITFEVVDTYVSPVWNYTETYQSLPVYTDRLTLLDSLNERISRDMSTIDTDTGRQIQLNQEDYTRYNKVMEFISNSRKDLYTFRRFFDFLQGKFTMFWLPSGNYDIIPTTSTLTSGSSTIVVVSNNLSTYNQKYIRVSGNIIAYFEILNVSDNLDGTETIAITPSVGTTVSNITKIEYMQKIRLDTDSIEFAHSFAKGDSPVTTIRTPVIEVL